MTNHPVIKEVKRKSIHVIPGFLAIPFIIWLGKYIALFTALIFFTLYTLNEISLRKNLGWRIPIAYKTYEIMARENEIKEKTFMGTVYFWGLTVAIIALLPPKPAAATIMVSSLGDAAAAITGTIIPRPRNPLNKRKSLIGSIAMFIVSMISCIIAGLNTVNSIIIATTSTLVEALTQKSINDEITVPLTAAITAYITYYTLA